MTSSMRSALWSISCASCGGRERRQQAVAHGVVADDVTLPERLAKNGAGPGAQGLVGLEAPAADEEHGFHPRAGEVAEEAVGGAGVRSVVEGEEHLAGARAAHGEVPGGAQARVGVEQGRGPGGRLVPRDHRGHGHRAAVGGVGDDDPVAGHEAVANGPGHPLGLGVDRHGRARGDGAEHREQGRSPPRERAESDLSSPSTHRRGCAASIADRAPPPAMHTRRRSGICGNGRSPEVV